MAHTYHHHLFTVRSMPSIVGVSRRAPAADEKVIFCLSLVVMQAFELGSLY